MNKVFCLFLFGVFFPSLSYGGVTSDGVLLRNNLSLIDTPSVSVETFIPKVTSPKVGNCLSSLRVPSISGMFASFSFDQLVQNIKNAACSFSKKKTGSILSLGAAKFNKPLYDASGNLSNVFANAGKLGNPNGETSVNTELGYSSDVQGIRVE